ncbi:MAG: MATE family efflux transporter [Rhodothermales bacterium]
MSEERVLYFREVKQTLLLAGPVIASQLGQMSMGFVDTVMVGRLGIEELAGVALGNTIFFVMVIVTMGVIMAVSPMVSQAYGSNDVDAIERSVSEGLRMGLVLSVIPFLVLWNIGPLLVFMGQVPETVALTSGYLRAIAWGIFPFLWYGALRSLVEGVSRPLPVTVITFIALGLNILANYVLMFGKWGFPAMGLEGTGWASAFVYWMMFFAIVIYTRWSSEFNIYRIYSRLKKIDISSFKEIFRVGGPIGVSHGIEAGLFAITALTMGLLGTVSLAAHQVAIQCASYTFMVPMGVGIAASVRVGQFVGMKDRKSAKRAGNVSLMLATLFMCCAAILFLVVPRSIIGLYINTSLPENAEVVELAIVLLGVAAIFQVFDGIQVAALGALRGLKDTRVPMIICFISYWLIGLAVGMTLTFVFDKGAVGLWWGLVLGLGAAAVMLTWRFRHSTIQTV